MNARKQHREEKHLLGMHSMKIERNSSLLIYMDVKKIR